jgi:hypothetical protein
LNRTISELKSELTQVKRDSIHESVLSGKGDSNEDKKQIKNLSEEVVRLRESVSGSSTEISALKSRLHMALDRAKKAELPMEDRRDSGQDSGDIELANGMRRRGATNRRSKVTNRSESIREALHLNVVQGEGTERIGKTLDSLDAFLTQSGKFLRYNPLARLLFILYLLLLHLWSFAVLFFHANAFETVHGDFGAGGGVPHGLNALMQQPQATLPVAKVDGN